jgi:hypothetical protein
MRQKLIMSKSFDGNLDASNIQVTTIAIHCIVLGAAAAISNNPKRTTTTFFRVIIAAPFVSINITQELTARTRIRLLSELCLNLNRTGYCDGNCDELFHTSFLLSDALCFGFAKP